MKGTIFIDWGEKTLIQIKLYGFSCLKENIDTKRSRKKCQNIATERSLSELQLFHI